MFMCIIDLSNILSSCIHVIIVYDGGIVTTPRIRAVSVDSQYCVG